jgi:hypothetical protein
VRCYLQVSKQNKKINKIRRKKSAQISIQEKFSLFTGKKDLKLLNPVCYNTLTKTVNQSFGEPTILGSPKINRSTNGVKNLN